MENFMNTSFKFLLVFLTVVIAACSSKGPMIADCTYPDSPGETAPAWICDEPLDGIEVSAVGFAKKSGAGVSHMKQMAVADARVQLAQSFRSHVINMIKKYVETTGAADDETVDQVSSSVSRLITDETLIGSRLFKSRTSSAGNLYVIVGLDSERVQKAAEESIKSSMKNDAALWQQFKAKKAQDELAAEISRMKAE
jgi:hypothetical protein